MKQERVREELAWSHPLVIAEIPPEGAVLELVPTETERAALARQADVLAVSSLVAHLKLSPEGGGGLAIEGDLAATVRQTCVVSLEPFDNEVKEHIALRFLPEGAAASASDGEADDLAEMIEGGILDLGAVMAEFLTLGVDPYPRRPGAIFAPPVTGTEGAASSPFAALAKLKQKGGQGD
jgi:uncharacterized metal-binding protein YceD (DUF177 family)